MEQMNLSGGGVGADPTHLDRLENLKEEVGVDVKPHWDTIGGDIKPPWDARKLISPPSPQHQQRGNWIRPEDYEDEQRAKSALENGVIGPGREFLENGVVPNEEDHFSGPYPGGPQGSPFHEGPPTPHGVHSFSPEQLMHNGAVVDGPPGGPNSAANKKSSSRRNAWGNLSYADLITQAILSSPEKRLTLSQVYDWMVQNIPYFKDKGDSNSSAGWKNSIRHNLSLHNKFIRVQNEGTGKSSWWMINPDAKTGGKSSRRRASNPDNGKGYDSKRRGRSKKSLDMLRNGQESTPSPSGMVEGFPDSPLHPGYPFAHDMRVRTGSNASDFTHGRISPLRGPHEFFQEGGWPPQEYQGMVGYGPAQGFRPPFCEGNEQAEQAMMERMGIDPRLSPHPGMPPHLRAPNGFPYPRPPFPHDPTYPHSPIMGGGPPPPGGDHPHFQNLHTMSPAHVPSLSPIPQAPSSYPSPDHTQQPATPVSAHEPLMSPHHLNQNGGGVFFPGGQHNSCALSSNPSSAPPDSPAPGSSSSSGSILERALAKQEPPSPLPHQPSIGHMEGATILSTSAPGHPGGHPGGHPLHPHHPEHIGVPHPGHHQPDWPHIAQGFGDVNVEEYIKNDFGMDSIEFTGYPGVHPGAQVQGDEQHHQYTGPHSAPVSVGPPWVR